MAKNMDDTVVVPLPGAQDAAPDLPRVDARTLLLGGIFLLVLLACMRIASEVVMPIVLAFVLKLVFQPVLRHLEKWRIPRKVAASLILVMLLSGVLALFTLLSGPAASWAEKFPASLPQIRQQIDVLKKPVEQTQKILGQAENLTKVAGPRPMPVAVQGTRLSDKVFIGTQSFATGLFTTMLVLFFLLAAGDTFLRRLVEMLPRFSDKRQAVDISQQIEHDVSVYLLTITLMNALVGVGTTLVMWGCGIADPVLWGTIAFLLNYVPIIGPLIATVIFVLVGLMADIDGAALLPAALYLLIHVLEGSFITPLLLARRFILNPVLVVVSLVFWYWMWGVPGAILSVPMLAITKIICDRIERFRPLGHFLEG